ncbi:hypothetical protein D0Y65_020962 [Glycine soja]|uniref:Uncharacterized protein n=1 Tax=Glycine soja TaxID=3848 RepID=A0A445JGT1_GLYSO|nr:hypothetical protein D0Y65_020962 [Glycine soja]
MDSGKTNEAPNAKLVRDFDLNISYVEEFDVNAEDKLSSPILMNTQPASQNCIENMNIQDEIANNGDTTIQANSAAKGVTSVSFAPGRISQYRRRRRRRSVECKPSTDPDRLCTNTYCKTRRTPLWRKGPLGPKIVKGTGSGLPAAVADDEGDASPGPVPAAEIVEEGDSNL